MTQNMTGGRVREHVAQLDVPPEPPAGSVVVSYADGVMRQSITSRSGKLAYPRRGDIFYDGLTWPQLLSYGAVEVIWRPDAQMPDVSTRNTARELLAALDGDDAVVIGDRTRMAADNLRRALNGEQTADASGAPG